MSNSNLTASLKRIKDIISKDVDIVDKHGCILHSSDPSRIGIVVNMDQCMPIDNRKRYFVHIECGSFKELSLVQLILKDDIIKGTADNYQQFLINILEGLEYDEEYSKRFKIPYDSNYIIYTIDLFNKEHVSDAYSLIKNGFCSDGDRWVFEYENRLVLLETIDTIEDEDYFEAIKHNAMIIKDTINSEVYTDIHIGIGSPHKGLLNIRKSFDEAGEAVRIGKFFNLPDYIYIYSELLAERIIKLVPKKYVGNLVSGWLNESIESLLDEEMIKTIEVFFKSNLNISDSARTLYIHRNTLIYRLDKVQKTTGLDIRKFEDAVIFKLILLLRQVNKYGDKTISKG